MDSVIRCSISTTPFAESDHNIESRLIGADMVGGGDGIGDWRTRPTFGGTLRRSASTPLQQRPPRYPEVQSDVAAPVPNGNRPTIRREEPAAEEYLKTFAFKGEREEDVVDTTTHSVSNAITTATTTTTTTTTTTADPTDDGCNSMDMSWKPSSYDPGSIEHLLEATISELTKQLDESAIGKPGNTDCTQSHPVPAIDYGNGGSSGNGNAPPEKKETRGQSIGNYDILPIPVPLNKSDIERLASVPGRVPLPPPIHESTKDAGVVSNSRQVEEDRNNYAGVSTGRYRMDCTVSDGARAAIRSTKDEPSTSNGIDSRSENNAGQLVISWDDRRGTSTTNKVDASVIIGTGTVANRVNIFDGKQPNDQGGRHEARQVSHNFGVGQERKVQSPPSLSPDGERCAYRVPDVAVRKPSLAQRIREQPYETASQTRLTLPSPSASLLPPPPASWQFRQNLHPSHEYQRHSSTTPTPPFCHTDKVLCSQSTDMLKFKVDSTTRHCTPPELQQKRSDLKDGRGGHVNRVYVEPAATHASPAPVPEQHTDLNAIGLRLERLIDQQSKNIQSINQMLEASRYRDGYSYMTIQQAKERDEDMYHKRYDDAPSAPRTPYAKTGKPSAKESKASLLSCIR